MLKPSYRIEKLPFNRSLETIKTLKEATKAHRSLADLKGLIRTLPNPNILIDTLYLQEALASSEIENIVTTQDELFEYNGLAEKFISGPAKEVFSYRDAISEGYKDLIKNKGNLTNNSIIKMYQILKKNDGGFRKTPGTKLTDSKGKIIYIPPQDPNQILDYMNNLETFINSKSDDIDPLIKMAIIHHQFESIHPFPDGNGRIGRMINVLFLAKEKLIETPGFYLSRPITKHKALYYTCLQLVRDKNDWETWIEYILSAIEITALQTVTLVAKINQLMIEYEIKLKTKHSKIYSRDLLNNLFRHPYTRIDFLMSELNISRQTAAKYLNQLANSGLLRKEKKGLNVYFVNVPLVDLFLNLPEK